MWSAGFSWKTIRALTSRLLHRKRSLGVLSDTVRTRGSFKAAGRSSARSGHRNITQSAPSSSAERDSAGLSDPGHPRFHHTEARQPALAATAAELDATDTSTAGHVGILSLVSQQPAGSVEPQPASYYQPPAEIRGLLHNQHDVRLLWVSEDKADAHWVIPRFSWPTGQRLKGHGFIAYRRVQYRDGIQPVAFCQNPSCAKPNQFSCVFQG